METLDDLTRRIAASKAASAFVDYARGRLLRQNVHDLPHSEAHQRIKAAATDDAALRNISTEYVAILERQTVLGQLRPQSVPPFVPVVDTSDDAIGGFVQEAKPIPVARLPLSTTLSEISKLATMIALDRRTAESGDARARGMIEAAMTNALKRLEDTELLSATAAIPGVRPAGLLAGAQSISGGGNASLADGISALMAAVSDGAPRRPVFIASPRVAVWLASNEGGLFQNAKVAGGDIAGIPLVVSPAAANRLILIDAGELCAVDDGLEVTAADSAAVAMSDTPTLPASLVSAWQVNARILRLVRYLWWTLTADEAVAYIEIAALGGSPA